VRRATLAADRAAALVALSSRVMLPGTIMLYLPEGGHSIKRHIAAPERWRLAYKDDRTAAPLLNPLDAPVMTMTLP
jgi:hypothetical protein